MNITIVINGQNAKTFYGVSLSDTALDVLMTPPPMKERVYNKTRLTNGATLVPTANVVDERTLSLPIHICAKTQTQFWTFYSRLMAVLKGGPITLGVTYPGGPSKIHTLYYESCSQYSQYYGGIAKFVLKLREPNPS